MVQGWVGTTNGAARLQLALVGPAAEISSIWTRSPISGDGAARRPWRRVRATAYDGPGGVLAAGRTSLEVRDGGACDQGEAVGDFARLRRPGRAPLHFIEQMISWAPGDALALDGGVWIDGGRLRARAQLKADEARLIGWHGGAAIEIRLLVGVASVESGADEGGEGPEQSDIAFAQLHLLDGPAAALFELGRDLVGASDGQVSVAAGNGADWVLTAAASGREALPALKVDVDPTADAGSALADALAACAERLVEVRAGLASGRCPEAARHARVALRRLRSIERAYRPFLGPAGMGRISRQARKLARLIGEARDWEVFIGETLPGLAVDAFEPRGARRLLRAARRRRAAAWTRIERAVGAPGYDRLVLDTFEAAADQPWRRGGDPSLARPVRAFADAALAERLIEAERVGALLGGGDNLAALHDLRLSVKRLRYVAQIFRAAYQKEERKTYFGRLGELQEALGVLNDAVVATRLAGEASAGAGARAARAAGYVSGRTDEKAAATAVIARDAFAALTATQPFWSARTGLDETPTGPAFRELVGLLREISEEAGE